MKKQAKTKILSFTSVKRTWNGVERIEYVCNGYHRYGKKNCPPHRIRETELDEIICGEITNVKEQAAQLYENIDGEVRKWLKKKSTVTGKIRQLNAELEQKKSDQKEILLERIRDKEHASVAKATSKKSNRSSMTFSTTAKPSKNASRK